MGLPRSWSGMTTATAGYLVLRDSLEIPGEAAKLAPLDKWLAGDIPAPVGTLKRVTRGGSPKALLAIERGWAGLTLTSEHPSLRWVHFSEN